MNAEKPSLSGSPLKLAGHRITLLGPLAGMSKREAARLIREQGGIYAEKPDAACTLVVWGEAELPLAANPAETGLLDDPTQAAAAAGRLQFISETELWNRLGLVDTEQSVHRLYTPAMLAELLSLPVAVIRRWHRRGLIVPVREVHRLPYFDFCEISTARRLAELLAAGCSPASIEQQLADLNRYLPNVDRPLAQLSVIIQGKQLLLRQGDGLLEPGGQYRFDFDAAEQAPEAETTELPGTSDLREISDSVLISILVID
jgi:DNA-binding transcriptional MerR regulator